MTENNKWWFLIPLPTALVLSYVLSLIRIAMSPGGINSKDATVIALFGIPLFPSGLLFVSAEDPQCNLLPICIIGYAIYFGIIFAGHKKPTVGLLATLCLLLILNIAGCQAGTLTLAENNELNARIY